MSDATPATPILPARHDGADRPGPRSAVVDLGSNSVRLVVFEGITRNPVPIFNEKATLRLGQGLEATGRLNEAGVGAALDVMRRFHAIARSMEAEPFQVLATAAVRDAENGPAFVESLREILPDVTFRILSGDEEADFAGTGVLCALPDADGMVADIGGGSLELIRLDAGARKEAVTLPLGVIRLQDRAQGDLAKARMLAEADVARVAWVPELKGRTLYLVGGAFRALARLQIARAQYPLAIVHLFSMETQAAREMADWVASASRRSLERLPNAPRKRLDDAPYAATVLRRLLRAMEPSRVVFCVEGLREGWYMRHVAPELMTRDPGLELATELAHRLGRSDELPRALVAWTDALFPGEDRRLRSLRTMACWMSDIGSFDHPEYRAEQTYLRILRVHGAGLDHEARAFLALTLAVRYETDLEVPWLDVSRRLLGVEMRERAVRLGLALRLAYQISGGTTALLDGSALKLERDELALALSGGAEAGAGSSVRRRLERLGEAFGRTSRIEPG